MSLVPPDSCGIRAGVTRADLYAIFQLNNRFTRQEVLRRHIGTRDQNVVTLSINDFQCRTQIFTTCGTFCGIQNHQRRQTGQFVGLTSNGLAVDHVSKAYKTAYFGDNRHGVRVPVCNGFAASNLFAIAFRQYRTVRYFVAFGTTEFVDQFQFGVTGSDNQFTAGVHNRLHVAELDATFVFHRCWIQQPHEMPHHRCGTYAWSAVYPVHRWTVPR